MFVSHLLHLADDLAGPGQALDHLLAFLAPPHRVVAFLEQVIQLVVAVHVFQEFALHLILGEPEIFSSHPWQRIQRQRTERVCT